MTTPSSSTTPSNASPAKVELVKRIVRLYGLRATVILPSSKGYRNDSTPVILQDGSLLNVIIYKREPGIVETIKRADTVSDFLAERGQPTRHTLSKKIAVLGQGGTARYANIYDYLPGTTIPWEAYSKGHIKAIGAGMSAMHALLASFDSLQLPNVEDIYGATLDRMSHYFADQNVNTAIHEKLQINFDYTKLSMYATILKHCKRSAARQALHMDYVRGNILFSDTKVDGLPMISGILDFEKTAFGHPLFDIARTLAFLLVDCKYKTSEKVTKYFLDSGYSKRGEAPILRVTITIGAERHDLLALLLDMFLLHDFYKFLRHNPYDHLAQNEHYVRTRDILISRGLIDKL
jgi:hypothetical protein